MYRRSIVSCVFFGEFIGALASGPFADTFGRKPVSVASASLVALAGFSSAFSGNVVTFLILRALCGVGIGGMAVSPSPPQHTQHTGAS